MKRRLTWGHEVFQHEVAEGFAAQRLPPAIGRPRHRLRMEDSTTHVRRTSQLLSFTFSLQTSRIDCQQAVEADKSFKNIAFLAVRSL